MFPQIPPRRAPTARRAAEGTPHADDPLRARHPVAGAAAGTFLAVPAHSAGVPAEGVYYVQSATTGLNAAVSGTAVEQRRPKGTKLTDRAERFCRPAARKKPNFLAVDHYNLGMATRPGR